MDLDQIFSVVNTIVLPGWLLLIIVPKWKYTFRLVFYLLVLFLAIAYSVLLLPKMGSMPFDSFSTLENISLLFQDREALLAGWIHYLAFDLLIGMGIVHDSNKNGINRFLVIPCLFFTLMSGPFGLLLYVILRVVWTKKIDLVVPTN